MNKLWLVKVAMDGWLGPSLHQQRCCLSLSLSLERISRRDETKVRVYLSTWSARLDLLQCTQIENTWVDYDGSFRLSLCALGEELNLLPLCFCCREPTRRKSQRTMLRSHWSTVLSQDPNRLTHKDKALIAFVMPHPTRMHKLSYLLDYQARVRISLI